MAGSFWKWVLFFIPFGENAEKKKKRQLKQIKKELKRNTYNRFFKVKTREFQPALAKFLYDIYKITAAAQVFMQGAMSSGRMKDLVVCFVAAENEELSKLLTALSEDAIEGQSEAAPVAELSRQLWEKLDALSVCLSTPDNAKRVIKLYNMVNAFVQFVSFDIFFIIKKFDPEMQERSFARQPHFVPVGVRSLIENIKDFIEVSRPVHPDQDWPVVLEIIKAYKGGTDVISDVRWANLLEQVEAVWGSQILELIVRHVEQNPLWESKYKISTEPLVPSWLEAKKTAIEERIKGIIITRRNVEITELARFLFGEAEPNRLQNYTEEAAKLYGSSNLDGFTQARALNFLMAFLQDYFTKEIKELCDILLISGQWSFVPLSKPLANEMYTLAALRTELYGFDDSVADRGGAIRRLKTAAERGGKIQVRQIQNFMDKVNREAEEIITQGIKSLMAFEQQLSTILHDYKRSPHSLIVNWHELDKISNKSMGEWITMLNAKINGLLKLLRIFVGDSQDAS
jgi:hypothetical protein